MASEIELKFLITTDGWGQYAGKPTEIKQYYLPSGTTLARDDNNVTITAPGYASVVIPVSELEKGFLKVFNQTNKIIVGDNTELRVRSKNEKLTITLKQETERDDTRKEFESSLKVNAFNALSEQSQGSMVVKERYKLDKKALRDAGIISQEMYDAVEEIIVDEYDATHHAYLQANGVPKGAVSEFEFNSDTTSEDLKEFQTELAALEEWFATPVTPEQATSLKNQKIAAAAAAAAAELAQKLAEKQAKQRE